MRSPAFSTSRRLVVPLRRSWVIITAPSALFVVSLSQSCEALLLRYRVDVRSDGEGHDVKERDPGVLGEELLGKGQSERGNDPANLHDRHEAGLPCRMDLVECSRARDDSHRHQIHTVLDRSNLSQYY
jgi:hypothetical protein